MYLILLMVDSNERCRGVIVVQVGIIIFDCCTQVRPPTVLGNKF